MTTTPNQISTIPVSIDYTGRDYYSIRQQLIARIQARIPSWTATDPSDFGIALVEASAYMGDLISYYIDRNANENSIYTATQRNSVLNIAQTFGYNPAGYRQAFVTLTFSNLAQQVTLPVTSATGSGTAITFSASNSFVVNEYVTITGFTTTGFNVTTALITSATATQFTVAGTTTGTETPVSASVLMTPPSITFPAGTVVSGQVTSGDVVTTLYYTTTDAVTIAANSSNTILATEGRLVTLVSTTAIATYGELIGTSDGSPNQTYSLLNTPTVDGTLQVYVQDGDVYSQWTQVEHLTDYGASDLIFTVSLDERDVVSITFGDGVSGAIPIPYSQIRGMYVVGGGAIGNISTGIATNISYVPGLTDTQVTALKSQFNVTNTTAAIGGDDPESTDQIRISAPASLRSANRAVTLKDYSDLALRVNNVGKANASASTWSSVTVYLAPTRSAGTADLQPGLDYLNNPTSEYTTLASTVSSFMADKILLGSSLTTQPPLYVDVAVVINFLLDPKYVLSSVTALILSTLNAVYGYNSMNFQDTIYPQDIETIVNTLGGVKISKVNALYRSGINITAATATGTSITYTTSANHGLIVGSTVSTSGLTPSGFNVTSVPVTVVPDSTHFTVASTVASGSSTGTGAMTAYTTLTGDPNEIFRLQVANINIGTI